MLTLFLNLAGQDSLTLRAPEDGPGFGRNDPQPHTRALLPGIGSVTVDLIAPHQGHAVLSPEQSVLVLLHAPEARAHPRFGKLLAGKAVQA
ncbi:hypothetical protein [Deinococcus aluminii]|uniref:Uncharacterized protein n=1 Tax=Deinococcus aluminii TaxID=1656885 RepID=A0ABP9XER1_9DEIO